MNYWEFVATNRRFLAFGFLLTWFASFGHTFFISLFGADIRDAFGLTHGGFGTIYTVATVADSDQKSACFSDRYPPWWHRIAPRHEPRRQPYLNWRVSWLASGWADEVTAHRASASLHVDCDDSFGEIFDPA